jgi:hypothetical protein
MIDLYRAGIFKLDELITTRYTIDEINRGCQDLPDGKNICDVVTSTTTDPVSRPAPDVLPAVLVLDRAPLPPGPVGADEMLLFELVRGRTARDQQV